MRKLIYIPSIVLLLASCGSGELTTSSRPNQTTSTTNNETTQTNNGSTSAVTNNQTSKTNNGTTVGATNNTTLTNNGTTAATNNGTTNGSNNGTTAGPVDHPMFIAVADFMREKCVNCHAPNENGNFTIPPMLPPTPKFV